MAMAEIRRSIQKGCNRLRSVDQNPCLCAASIFPAPDNSNFERGYKDRTEASLGNSLNIGELFCFFEIRRCNYRDRLVSRRDCSRASYYSVTTLRSRCVELSSLHNDGGVIMCCSKDGVYMSL
jgi:hypothetical protein